MDRVLFRIWHDILIKYFKYIYFSYCFSWTLEKKTGSYCMGVGLDQIWRGWTFTPAIWSKSKNNKVRYYSYKIKNVKQHKRYNKIKWPHFLYQSFIHFHCFIGLIQWPRNWSPTCHLLRRSIALLWHIRSFYLW